MASFETSCARRKSRRAEDMEKAASSCAFRVLELTADGLVLDTTHDTTMMIMRRLSKDERPTLKSIPIAASCLWIRCAVRQKVMGARGGRKSGA